MKEHKNEDTKINENLNEKQQYNKQNEEKIEELEKIWDEENNIDNKDKKINELEKEIDELNDKYLRGRAELENYIKRAEKQLLDNSKYAISGFAKELLDVGDALERAINSIIEEENKQISTDFGKKMREGIEMTEKLFFKTLERFQVKKINADIGENFDPNLHQAMAEINHEQIQKGQIVQVFQNGYVIDTRVLRPALVVVSKGSM